MLRSLGFIFQARTSEFAKREENVIGKLQTPYLQALPNTLTKLQNSLQHSALSITLLESARGNGNLGFFYVEAAECLLVSDGERKTIPGQCSMKSVVRLEVMKNAGVSIKGNRRATALHWSQQ